VERIKPNEDERKLFLRALLQIDWLPRKVRRAILQELGYSLRKYRAAQLGALQLRIDDTREGGQRGGIQLS
jgi:hypothetical protein